MNLQASRKIDRRQALLALTGVLWADCGRKPSPPGIAIGAKKFTEQSILAEILAQLIEHKTNLAVTRKPGLDDTDQAIRSKVIDAYVEYSGTAWVRNLRETYRPQDEAKLTQEIREAYRNRGLAWLDSLGFRDDFAIVILKSDSEKYNVRTLDDARRRAGWRVADGADFETRPDGLAAMLTNYDIHLSGPPLTSAVDDLYKMLEDRRVDMIAANSTDRFLGSKFNLFATLDDTRHIFPPYDATIVARIDTLNQFPMLRSVFAELSNKITKDTMRSLIEQYDEATLPDNGKAAHVAKSFLNSHGV